MTGVPESLAAEATSNYRKQASLAISHPALFNEFVLVDETTGRPIESAPIHDEMIAFIGEHPRVVVEASPEMGKTQQMIGWMLREIGRDTTGRWRGLIGSKIAANAQKPSRQMMRYIEHSPEYKMCFPSVRPGPVWRADGWKIEGAAFGDPKDMTIATCGVGGSILGSRANFALLDDMFDWENTRTEYRSDQIVDWVLQQLESRMAPDGKIVLLKNAWQAWDGGRKLVEKHGWRLFKLAARDPETKRSNWPARWPQSRLDNYPPAIAGPHLDVEPLKEGASMINDAWITACKGNGRGLTLIQRLTPASMPPGAYCVTGIDPNHKKKKKSDLTVLFTLMVVPDEAGGLSWIRPIWIDARVMNSPEIKAAIVDHYDRYGSRFIVEDNAAQSYIVDDLQLGRPDIKVEPFTTTSNKWDPNFGIGGIAIELSMGRWILPSMPDGERLVCEPALETWLGHMRKFAPTDRSHTADDIMASWIAWRGARGVFSHRVEDAGDVPEDAPPPLPLRELRVAQRKAQDEGLWAVVERLGLEPRDPGVEPDDDGDDSDPWYERDRM